MDRAAQQFLFINQQHECHAKLGFLMMRFNRSFSPTCNFNISKKQDLGEKVELNAAFILSRRVNVHHKDPNMHTHPLFQLN